MMIARPTAASAAATVMTRKTKTCPPAPYSRANAMNVRFTELRISSTHMKRMMALRRVSTPTTPIANSTAEKNSDSASIGPPDSQDHGADDGGKEHHARDFEGEQILMEERPGERRDGALGGHLRGRVALGERVRSGRYAVDEREQFGDEPNAPRARGELPAQSAG